MAGIVALESVHAEQHAVSFTNECGFGTPNLWSAGGQLLSTGGSVTFNGATTGLLA
ncbi:hypothetical protein FOMPIDRAFT_84912 [Fomitopsis schrenkii]|uniref:Uncharacterized protein n=1 Tax=Fomitopsis schrenkii TaxID=2126942 RepID=S8FSU7_FOMSC|nr:hypothetical protein FOMPIDRAFT_84912 [Fomitopsis schrenkii]